MKQACPAALALVLSFSATSAISATVLNGSFEDIGTGTLNNNGWNHFDDIPGWSGLPNVEVQSNSTLGSSINTPFGTRYAELDTDRDAAIYQDINLAAGLYQLSFWYSPRVNATPTSTNDMDYSVTAGSTLLSGSINGAPNTAFPHGQFTEVTGTFKVDTASTVRLFFQATGGSHFSGCGNCGALIDNVAVDLIPTPLPAAGWMLLAGVGGIAGLRRYRKG